VSKRSDLIFKTILRKVRKVYLADFNKTTGYIKGKKNQDKKFYLEKLHIYTHQTFPRASENEQFLKELVFFLGSMFYPKE
jgi:hypothetical protein